MVNRFRSIKWKVIFWSTFHSVCWDTIVLPNSERESSMFHAGPLAAEFALDPCGSHENFQSQWTTREAKMGTGTSSVALAENAKNPQTNKPLGHNPTSAIFCCTLHKNHDFTAWAIETTSLENFEMSPKPKGILNLERQCQCLSQAKARPTEQLRCKIKHLSTNFHILGRSKEMFYLKIAKTTKNC